MSRILLTLVGALTAALTLVGVAPARAATYPTLSAGSTGPSVTSLQLLLPCRARSTTADGDFGSGTTAAQKVQRSAYPDAYARWETLARDIVAREAAAAPPIS